MTAPWPRRPSGRELTSQAAEMAPAEAPYTASNALSSPSSCTHPGAAARLRPVGEDLHQPAAVEAALGLPRPRRTDGNPPCSTLSALFA
ncbi:hypothetical protein V2J94_00400 [Streptomyces sp. DSM 41524]|uniref:Uncharacterized protein n=1 Tax=Streptomyces asiaticus subsp. ignotus TaxID=3098222 RepID=A0ABU7PMQ9_9ACTN|nr:hypothetical protein [Streptomyces sp. DSM 41524]